MISEEIKNKIKILYSQKKYQELIEFSEKFTSNDERPSALLNILGLAYFLKNNSNEGDINLSLSFFEQAYVKDSNSTHGFNALKNLILIGIKASIVSKNFFNFLVKAEKFYEEAEVNFDENEEFLELGLNLYLYLLDTKKQKKIINKILSSTKDFKKIRGQAIFMCNYHYAFSQNEIYKNTLKNLKFFIKFNSKKIDKIKNINDTKIKLGFVSCDFIKNHSTTYFVKNILRYLDKKKFKIFNFSINKKNLNDPSQNELRKFSDEWFDVGDFNNEKIVNIIQEQNVDILIDLIGFTNTNRLEIFNSRIAPIQISWLAYCNTTGLGTMDYLIADRNLIYDEEDNQYSEKIIKLPDIWNSHSGFEFDRNFCELPALSNKNFTFGSFNNFRKISDETIDVWSEILKRTENSLLILKSSEFCNDEILLKKFEKKGVQKKIKILNKLDFKEKKEHLNLYKEIDLALDTFPYNGVTTTFEALWMNVPVLVLKGFNFNSRCGESIIKNSKLDYFIAKNKSEYIEKALYLSKNKEVIIKFRKQIYETILSSPLFESKRFSVNLQNSLLKLI